MVAALVVSQTVGYGALYYAFAVLLVPIAADLHVSTTAVTGAFTAATLAGAATAVPVGRWLDRHGGRGLMTAGSVIATVLLLLAGQVASPARADPAGPHLARTAVDHRPHSDATGLPRTIPPGLFWLVRVPFRRVRYGAPGRNRTYDTRFRRAVLYPLSYEGRPAQRSVQGSGLLTARTDEGRSR